MPTLVLLVSRAAGRKHGLRGLMRSSLPCPLSGNGAGWGQGCSKGQTDSWAGKLQLLRFGTILSPCEYEHSSLLEAWALEPGESEESCDPVLSCPATWGRDPELPSPLSSALKRVVLSF